LRRLFDVLATQWTAPPTEAEHAAFHKIVGVWDEYSRPTYQMTAQLQRFVRAMARGRLPVKVDVAERAAAALDVKQTATAGIVGEQ
jgi:hypothetical protein